MQNTRLPISHRVLPRVSRPAARTGARVRLLAVLVPVALAAGCANTAAPSSDVAVDTGGTARYVLPATRATSLNERNAAEAFAAAAQQASRVRGQRQDRGLREGLFMRPDATGVTVAYVSESGQPLNRTHNQVARFDVSYATQGADKVLTVRCPDQLRVEFNNGVGMGTYPPLVPREVALADLRTMCRSARFAWPQREAGEVDAGFGDSAVYANFARKLRPHTWQAARDVTQADIAKYKWFVLADGGVEVPVGVTVFPYRAGSKVTYTWTSEYACRGDGRCAYAITPARVRELVAAIAND